MAYSKVIIWSSYVYVYFSRIKGIGWIGSSLKQLCKRIYIEGKSEGQTYNWVVDQFKGNDENIVDMDEGYIMKIDMNNYVPGKKRGRSWEKRIGTEPDVL